jgi:hypothetical protein
MSRIPVAAALLCCTAQTHCRDAMGVRQELFCASQHVICAAPQKIPNARKISGL